jgi:hypothetical protein
MGLEVGLGRHEGESRPLPQLKGVQMFGICAYVCSLWRERHGFFHICHVSHELESSGASTDERITGFPIT